VASVNADAKTMKEVRIRPARSTNASGTKLTPPPV
jgi:hypothetical protein